jgi:hypothetical protein
MMTPSRVLDSLPYSEAPARADSEAMPSGLPSWKRCDIHRVSVIFECKLCTGAILGYGH